ncbi:MAG: RecA-superfamily ATPase [Thermoanaerobacterales bacterium 50_218]|nr:MAG: RecA-superfamily ATPase [Thermoanaerobacterales bacterium 50_218]HAA89188.1 hypothetical protein [Peptococcaceae bacterium]
MRFWVGVFLGVRASLFILVEGGAGTGKTLLGIEFLVCGAKHYKEKGVFVSFEESPQVIQTNANGLPWNLQHLVEKRMLEFLYTEQLEVIRGLVQGGIFLKTELVRHRRVHFIEVYKMRGTGYLPGCHLMEVSGSGIKVFPRSGG